MDVIQQSFVIPVSDFLWNYVLVYVLIGAGLYFGIRTRFVQLRLFPAMIRSLTTSRSSEGGISPFQAFCIGLSSRVGTGNITGVAIALTLGGPGAIFWMWVVALIGMATAFVEATLAQVFKTRSPDGTTFVGGPAYYIQRGLKTRVGGIVFAVLLIFTFGVAFSMVQANTIADVVKNGDSLSTSAIAVVLVLITAPILFGGLKRVAKVAEVVLPVMALSYIGLALVVVVLNADRIVEVFGWIVQSAFGLNEALAGTAGGIAAALLNGTKRGLFSNEAGLGSAPNTAATATTAHPVNQGFIQSLGVFVDTILICSATAFIIMASGVYTPGGTDSAVGASLTRSAFVASLGDWSAVVLTVLIFTFAFTSIIGNYAYVEVNVDYLGGGRRALTLVRLMVLASIATGAVIALDLVWQLADVAMGVMALANLLAITLLAGFATATLRDWERQRAAGVTEPHFVAAEASLPRQILGNVWLPGGTPVPSHRGTGGATREVVGATEE